MTSHFDFHRFFKVFFPLGVFLGLLNLARNCLLSLRSSIEAALVTGGNPQMISPYKMWGLGALCLFTVLLMILVYRVSARKLVEVILLAFMLVLGILEGVYQWSNFAATSMVFAIVCELFNPALIMLLGWGTINYVSTLSEGYKYYIPLIFLASLLSIPDFFLVSQLFLRSHTTLFSLALLALLGALWAQQWALSRPHAPEEAHPSIPPKFSVLFSLCVLMSGTMVAQNWIGFDFKSWMKLSYPAAGQYSEALGIHVMAVGIGTIVVSFVSLFLGEYIIQRRGWGHIAMVVPFVLILCAGALVANLLGLPSLSLYTLAIACLKGIHLFLLVPIVQIIFLRMPKERRLPMLAWVCLVLTPIATSFFTPQWVLILLGSDGPSLRVVGLGMTLGIGALMVLAIFHLKNLSRKASSVVR